MITYIHAQVRHRPIALIHAATALDDACDDQVHRNGDYRTRLVRRPSASIMRPPLMISFSSTQFQENLGLLHTDCFSGCVKSATFDIIYGWHACSLYILLHITACVLITVATTHMHNKPTHDERICHCMAPDTSSIRLVKKNEGLLLVCAMQLERQATRQ
jgi:hypothetical protein